MTLHEALRSLQETWLATHVRETANWFPWIECIHVLALTLVFGSISAVDLQILRPGALLKGVQRAMRELLPITWSGFAIATVTGSLLFASAATKYASLTAFKLKLVLLVAAGANAAAFHGMTAMLPRVRPNSPPTRTMRASAAISIALWIAILMAGRWIGFSDPVFTE